MGCAVTLRRLPQRRGAIAVELEHAGHHFRMQIGCLPHGALGEVFLDAAKQNDVADVLDRCTAALTEKLRDEFADVQRQAAADRSFTDE